MLDGQFIQVSLFFGGVVFFLLDIIKGKDNLFGVCKVGNLKGYNC